MSYVYSNLMVNLLHFVNDLDYFDVFCSLMVVVVEVFQHHDFLHHHLLLLPSFDSPTRYYHCLRGSGPTHARWCQCSLCHSLLLLCTCMNSVHNNKFFLWKVEAHDTWNLETTQLGLFVMRTPPTHYLYLHRNIFLNFFLLLVEYQNHQLKWT